MCLLICRHCTGRNAGVLCRDDVHFLISVHCDSSQEVSRAKDVLKRAGGEDVASAGEKSVSGHTVGKSVSGSIDETRDAYRAREPRAEVSDTVDTVNAYRSKEPRSEQPASQEEILDEETRSRRAV